MRGSKRELAILFAGQICLALLSLGFLQALLLVLDQVSYGLFMFVFSTALTLSMLLFNPGIVPVTRVAANSADRHQSGGVVVDLLVAAALPAALVCVALAGTVFAMSGNLVPGTAPWMALAGGVLAAAAGIIALITAFAQGCRRRLLNVGLNNGVIALRIVLVLAAAAAGIAGTAAGADWAVGGTLGAVALASFAVAALALTIVRARQPWTPPRIAIATLSGLGFFRQYRQNLPLLAGSALFQHGDKVILGFVLPLEVLGLLALYQQLARVLTNTTTGAVQQYLAPFFLTGDVTARQNALASLLAMTCLIPAAGLVAVLLGWISSTLLHGVYALSADAFLVVCLIFALLRGSQINELAFFRTDRVGLLLAPLVAAIVVIVVAGPVLAAAFGLWGAIASLLGATAVRYGWGLWAMRQL